LKAELASPTTAWKPSPSPNAPSRSSPDSNRVSGSGIADTHDGVASVRAGGAAPDGTHGVAGVAILAADETAVAQILDADPAIRAGVLTYELHPTRTFTVAAAKG
jgi:hypothetical protein